MSGSITAIKITIEALEIEYFVTGSVVDIEIMISVHYHLPYQFLDTECFVSGSVTEIKITIETLDTEYFVTGSVKEIEIMISFHYQYPSQFLE